MQTFLSILDFEFVTNTHIPHTATSKRFLFVVFFFFFMLRESKAQGSWNSWICKWFLCLYRHVSDNIKRFRHNRVSTWSLFRMSLEIKISKNSSNFPFAPIHQGQLACQFYNSDQSCASESKRNTFSWLRHQMVLFFFFYNIIHFSGYPIWCLMHAYYDIILLTDNALKTFLMKTEDIVLDVMTGGRLLRTVWGKYRVVMLLNEMKRQMLCFRLTVAIGLVVTPTLRTNANARMFWLLMQIPDSVVAHVSGPIKTR